MGHGVLNNGQTAEAPEGGWGYVIMVSLSFLLLVTSSFMSCLGLLFDDFLLELGLQTRALTMLPSVFMICSSIVGIFTKSLFERFSVRSVAILGAILFCSGSLMLVFVRSFNELVIAYCVMQGIGFGLTIPALYATLVQYFVRRRVMIMGLVGTMQCLCASGLPIFVEHLKQEYGFRGCLLILAAINLHVIFGMIALHPVKWHQKGVVRKAISLQVVAESENLLQGSSGPDSKRNIWKKMVDSLDLKIFLIPTFTNIVVGISIAVAADMAFVTIQSSYLRHISFSTMDAAKILSIGASADMVSRAMLSLIGSCVKVQARPLFLVGLIATIGLLIAYQNVTSFFALSAVTALLGFFRSWFHVTISIIFAEYLPAERFPSGYGMYIFMQGLCFLPFGVLIGWIRDVTGSFLVTFNVLVLAMVLCVVPWSVEMFYTRCKSGANQQTRTVDDGQHNLEENV